MLGVVDATLEIAQALGGEITVESSPGKGATFTLSVPVSLVSEPTELDALQTNVGRTQTCRLELDGMNALMVEDHTLNAKLIEKDTGCEVVCVETAYA